MLDDFRKQADDSSLFEEKPAEQDTSVPEAPAKKTGYFLGMTPAQRFIIAVMLLVLTCMLSAVCLLVTEKVVPPFLYF